MSPKNSNSSAQGNLWDSAHNTQAKKPNAADSVRLGDRQSPLSVTQVVRRASRALDNLGSAWVEGEVVSVSRPTSGHIYFSLRDDSTSLRAVLWRSEVKRLGFDMEEGLKLRCRGRSSIYDRDGTFQFYVQAAEPAGLGRDALALAALRKKLQQEGLFDASRKRRLPVLPRRIGVVTSKSGAAVRDIIHAVQRRFPVPILVSDTSVQGESAPSQIIRALQAISRTDVDVVIIGRGGGSAGDLAAFNDEGVVRAVAAMPIAVVSAVGHEIDLSLTDLAADQRAATPTMAGEMVVPVWTDLAADLDKIRRRLQREVGFYIHQARHDLDRISEAARQQVFAEIVQRRKLLNQWQKHMQDRHPRVRLVTDRAQLDTLSARLENKIRDVCASRLNQLALLGSRLDALSPLKVLRRGYAVAMSQGKVVVAANSLSTGDSVTVRVCEGHFDCTVVSVHPQKEPVNDYQH